jgi:hypothetical protein
MKRETANTGTPAPEREGGVGVAQVVEAADWLDPGRELCRPPVLASEDPEVDPATAHVRKQNRVVRRRQPVEGVERLRLQRDRARAQPRLRVLEPAVRVGATNVDGTKLAVNVALVEPKQLRRSQPCRGREDHHRPVHQPELRRDGFHGRLRDMSLVLSAPA